MNMYRIGWSVLLKMHDVRRQNLVKRNYNPNQAAVLFSEFVYVLQQHGINREAANEIKRKLIEVGYIENFGNYIAVIKENTQENKNG